MKEVPMIGLRFGKLTVLAKSAEGSPQYGFYYEVKCDCGKTKVVRGQSLRDGVTHSCGCLSNTQSPLKSVAHCRHCLWAWRPTSGEMQEPCPKCGKIKDVRIRERKPLTERGRATLRDWQRRNPKSSTIFTRKIRRKALLLVGDGQIRCVRCNCDDVRCIEINHKNGGGRKEMWKRSTVFYYDIATLRRSTDDLELLCRPCNAIHALEMKLGPIPAKVVWGTAA